MTDILRDNKSKILEGETIKTSVYFGRKDGALLTWAQSVPWGAFSYIVRGAIKAYISGQPSYQIPQFPEKEGEKKDSISKAYAISNEDYEVYEFIVSIDKFSRGHEIKKILKSYLEEKEVIPKEAGIVKLKSYEEKTKEKKTEEDKSNSTNPLLAIAERMNSGPY